MRKIEAVDFFYLSMPDVSTKGDGSQDALLIRVAAGGLGGRRNQGQGKILFGTPRLESCRGGPDPRQRFQIYHCPSGPG